MASYNIRTAGNCPAVLFTIRSPFNIRIGRGNSLPIRLLQAGHSSLPQQKLESVAEIAAATIAAGGTILLCGNEN